MLLSVSWHWPQPPAILQRRSRYTMDNCTVLLLFLHGVEEGRKYMTSKNVGLIYYSDGPLRFNFVLLWIYFNCSVYINAPTFYEKCT